MLLQLFGSMLPALAPAIYCWRRKGAEAWIQAAKGSNPIQNPDPKMSIQEDQKIKKGNCYLHWPRQSCAGGGREQRSGCRRRSPRGTDRWIHIQRRICSSYLKLMKRNQHFFTWQKQNRAKQLCKIVQWKTVTALFENCSHMQWCGFGSGRIRIHSWSSSLKTVTYQSWPYTISCLQYHAGVYIEQFDHPPPLYEL